ncbi:zwei Ig domain protein zig-8-like [Eriocheir sinensis]|uniref:zwei Ig domain protein zig-8-like n=1 Tax=Eriocheir sinensis TaxID=95602 RepID=UPI0021CA9936|nr:zwei Ig domain protein zig-8-like [Eriocheir sinensis]XP_050707948.1 zwei Ig domain protein zig-8-like [Eriocheir sinensis]
MTRNSEQERQGVNMESPLRTMSTVGSASIGKVTGVLTLLILPVTSFFVYNDKPETPQRMWDPEKGVQSFLGLGMMASNFGNMTVLNQTGQLGSTTYLHCHVRNLANKQVSWIRRRDYHILTSGLHTYSLDERFSIVRSEDGVDWALQIRFLQKHDEGTYECQVSTPTGRYGYLLHLYVVVPEAVIKGPAELHLQHGSTFSLVCNIQGGLTPPQFIFWFHNNKMINYDQSRGGVTVAMISRNPAVSRITIRDATFTDTGNYTCTGNNITPASIIVFVSEGHFKTAAIQRLESSAITVIQLNSISILSRLFAVMLVCLVNVFYKGT